jgi:hypothetical protein
MDGTQGLSDSAYRAYHVICQLIVLNEGPIAFNERGIAGRCNQSLRKLRLNVADLIEAGKLKLEDGKLSNSRPDLEIGDMKVKRKHRRKGGRKSGASGEGSREGDSGEEILQLPWETGQNEVRQDTSEPDRQIRPTADEFWPRDAWHEFWKLYPNKVGKGYAQECFNKVRKSRKVTFKDLMDGLRRYVNKSDDRPWCNPSTWLNQDRWLDQPAQKSGSDKNMPAFSRSYAI